MPNKLKQICQNCKWWTRNLIKKTRKETRYVFKKYSDQIIDSKFGRCNHGCMQYTHSGGCIEDDDFGDNNDNGLIFSDNEALGAYLYTGQNFGCIHFEVKQ